MNATELASPALHVLVLVFSSVFFACGGEDGLSASSAVAIAREHAEEFDSFERWSRRIASAETTFHSRAALEEAAFAPVRRQQGVVGAWIERIGPDAWELSHPRRATIPPELTWRRARLDGLREYEIAVSEQSHYVRARSETTGGAMLVVSLAFSRSDSR
jgi:hypothetical protein